MMRIIFERSGGFMGRKVSLDLDLATLPPDQADAVKLLVAESDFLNLTALPTNVPAPDGFAYSITVETGTIQHTVQASDANFPQVLRPLLDDLLARARSR